MDRQLVQGVTQPVVQRELGQAPADPSDAAQK